MNTRPFIYPVDWQGLESFNYHIDQNGVPRVDYGGDLGLQYAPITIAQYGLHHMTQWAQSGSIDSQTKALACCQWLLENGQSRDHDSFVWIYDYGFDFYGPEPPWISAMAQGEAVSLLLRAFWLKKKKDYLDACHEAVKPFYHSIDDGGVVDKLYNSLVFEEYPTDPPSHVLNGHIFALIGAYEYACFTGNQRMIEIYSKGLSTLENHWHLWDVGFWTRYDLYPVQRLASIMYQRLHVRQMRTVATLFKKPVLHRVAKRWHRMINPINMSLWAATKSLEKWKLRRGRH